MELVPAGAMARLERHVGDHEPYATSHDALDRDEAVQEEVRNGARAVVRTVHAVRRGELVAPDRRLRSPRPG